MDHGDARERWFCELVDAGLSEEIFDSTALMKHATPEVLASNLPPELMAKVLESALSAGKMTTDRMLETLTPSIIAHHIPHEVLWECVVEAARRAGIADANGEGTRGDKRRAFLRRVITHGLDQKILSADDILAHANPGVVGPGPGRPLGARITDVPEVRARKGAQVAGELPAPVPVAGDPPTHHRSAVRPRGGPVLGDPDRAQVQPVAATTRAPGIGAPSRSATRPMRRASGSASAPSGAVGAAATTGGAGTGSSRRAAGPAAPPSAVLRRVPGPPPPEPHPAGPLSLRRGLCARSARRCCAHLSFPGQCPVRGSASARALRRKAGSNFRWRTRKSSEP